MGQSRTPAEDWRQRLAFLGLGDEDLTHLERLRPLIEDQADGLVSAFYRHLLSFEPARALLRDPEVKERLLEKQREYLLSLSGPKLDEDYELERRLIGGAHMRVGVEPRWYLGAYAHYASLLIPLIREAFKPEPAKAEATTVSLIKLLLLDAQLAMETYIERREEQLEHLNRELTAAARDLERAYRDRDSQLRETTERVQAAEELASVATIVAGLAHEIGTPMGVIRGHAELLESSVTDERGRWRLETIREQIDRIASIIQTLLKLARPRATEHALVDLGRVIEDSLAFLSEKFRHRSIQIESELPDGVSVLGDAEKLQQLFLNLFLNSVDAMGEGGTLRVRLMARDEGGGEVSVRDSGGGIDPGALEHVFDPFYTSKAAGKGSGLGLTVCRRIARDHGGTIEVSSEPADGTEFRIVFPRPSPS